MYCCSRCRIRSSTCRPSPSGCQTARSRLWPATSTPITMSPSPISSSRRRDVRGTVERLVRERRPDVVGLSVMTFQRGTALNIATFVRRLRPGVSVVVGGYDPSLAPEAYEACRRRGLHRARRRRADVLRAAPRAGKPRRISRRAGSVLSNAGRFQVAIPTGRSPGSPPIRFGFPTAPRACSAGTRCSAAAWTSSKRRADARSIAASVRSSRCAAAISTPIRSSACWPMSSDARSRGAQDDLSRRRQHHARCPPIRIAVPRDHRRRLQRHRLRRAGDDVAAGRARRDTGAAHAARGVSLRVPRHRERARRGSRRF